MLFQIFTVFFKMSYSASWLILAVIVLRLLLRKAPKQIICFLWALAAVRLLCPFTVESAFSLIPDSGQMADGIAMSSAQTNAAMQNTGIPGTNQKDGTGQKNMPNDLPDSQRHIASNNTMTESERIILTMAESEKIILSGMAVFSIVWLTGISAMAVYGIVSFRRLCRRTAASVKISDFVFLCDEIDTPFILGIIMPKIYLPSSMKKPQSDYVIAHEKAHIKRHDHWWKPFGFVLLSVYWFNPLCWAAYILFCRDIELACDEQVVKTMDLEGKKSYAKALLSCSVNRKTLTACPLAFGEVGVKERIKSVLNYKKPAFWLLPVSFAACIIVAVCFLTNPKQDTPGEADAQEPVSISESGISDASNEKNEISDAVAPMEQTEENISEEEKNLRQRKLQETIQQWAEAFISRDGNRIAALSSPELTAALAKEEMLTGSAGQYSFGWSSPWPLFETDYEIRDHDENSAEIGYYAHTSDPHITYWVETLQYEWTGEDYVITGEELVSFDDISSGEEFYDAYQYGIDGTMIDYTANGLGEVLNDNAARGDHDVYQALFSPESAAVFLLNLSDDPDAVKITRQGAAWNNLVRLDITFTKDQSTETVSMLRPYGKNGIWVPVDYRVDVLSRFMAIDWNEVETIPYTGYISDSTEILCIGEIPEYDIKVYGYADEEIFGYGVAIDIAGDVNYFDWDYMTPRTIFPDLYWDEENRQLQIAFHTYTGTGIAAEQLYVLQQFDTGTLQPCGFDGFDLGTYRRIVEERIGYTYDAEEKLLTFYDSRTGEELISEPLDLGGAPIIGMEYGNISGFFLGEKIYFYVTPGYTPEGSAIPYYDNMPSIEFEVVMETDNYGTSAFDLGEITGIIVEDTY